MWVFEEFISGEKLTELINKSHENVKYLPGIKLPSNVVATPSLEDCTRDADVLVFVMPHQFLTKVCQTMKPFLKPGVYGCSLIKVRLSIIQIVIRVPIVKFSSSLLIDWFYSILDCSFFLFLLGLWWCMLQYFRFVSLGPDTSVTSPISVFEV